MCLFCDYAVYYRGGAHQHAGEGAAEGAEEAQARSRESRPFHREVGAIDFRKDFAEEKDKECDDHRLEDKAQHSTHILEYRAEGEVGEHHYRYIYEIVGDEDCGKQPLWIFEQPQYRARAWIVVIEVLDLGRG